jgi:hypothetical protein
LLVLAIVLRLQQVFSVEKNAAAVGSFKVQT